MSQHGPILVVADGACPLAGTIAELKLFPLVEARWEEASSALRRLRPAAVLAMVSRTGGALDALAADVAAIAPYVPLIVLDPPADLPLTALPFAASGRTRRQRLVAFLTAALRLRTLHATVLRRLASNAPSMAMPPGDPLDDATVLLLGRGTSYPALSVALGETVGVVGALSIEAAARHLNARDLDGIVIGEGFTPRVVDAFLTALAEDARFRNLPVVLSPQAATGFGYDLPCLDIAFGDAPQVASRALPLIRQNAFETRLKQMLKAIDARGLVDPRTGLLTREAFRRELAAAIGHAHRYGASFAAARILPGTAGERARLDAVRILGRLMRRVDFATLDSDGSILAAFPDLGARDALATVRRLCAVLKQTALSSDSRRLHPQTTVVPLQPGDTAQALLARLREPERCAAS